MGTAVREFGIEVGFDGKWKKVKGGSKNLVVGVALRFVWTFNAYIPSHVINSLHVFIYVSSYHS